jgi:hypothetical protein
MAAPVSAINTRGQSMDTMYATDSSKRVKYGIGSIDIGLDEDAGWQGVATHADEDAFGAGDGIVVVGGVDSVDGVTPRRTVVDDIGRFIVTLAPYAGAFTDQSATLTTGGVAETVVLANADRRYLLIQNVDTTENLWVNFGASAVDAETSILLTPYGSLVFDGSFITTQYVSVYAETTGHPFTIKEA